MAGVPEALVEVTVHSSVRPRLPVDHRQRALCKNTMQENFSSRASLGTFPAQGSELLSRLDRGEVAWVPDLQSSEESADEGPVKPTLKRWPKAGMWWDLYRAPAMYPSTSESSEDEQESEDDEEEEKPPRRGHKLTILRRSVLDIFKGNGSQSVKQMEASKDRPQLKKHLRGQLGKIKCNAKEVVDVAPCTAKEKEPQRPCPDCGQAFKTKASLLRHQKTHSGQRPYECSFCGERFTAQKALVSHQRRHAEERGYKHPKAYLRKGSFKCPECEKCFQRKGTLKAHLNSHTAERPYKCLECEAAFIRKEHLNRHQKIHTREKADRPPKGERKARAAISPDEKKPPPASVSEGTFLSGLGADRQQETSPNLYKCHFCGRCMRTKSLLVDHERIHKEERPYKCSQCQKSFLHKHSFLQHEATHQRKAACKRPVRMSAKYTPSASSIIHRAENASAVSTDGKQVSNVHNLSRRPRSPGGERVYKCQYCGKCLSGSGPLTNHEKLHRRGRSYKCPDCVKHFSRKDDLLQHKATHKKQKPARRPRLKSSHSERIHTEPKPHRDRRDCIVTRSVARSLSLSKHLKTYTESKVYKCQYCGENTRTKSLLADHERIHRRKKKPYQCLECGKSFSQKNYIACHQRGHVRKELSKLSDTDQKMTTSNRCSLKSGNPHRKKAPRQCFKCEKHFDGRYHLTKHQMTHLAEKPFKCVCGKGFIQMWHLKRHEKAQLNKKCYKELIRAEGNSAILNSANGVHPEEKNQGELPEHTEPPTASSTDTEEENTCSLVALEEPSEVEILDVSEQGGMHVQAQGELSKQSQQNSLQNCRDGIATFSPLVESERKLSGKEHILCCKQDAPSKGQLVHPRHCSKRARLQSHKQKKASVKWQLRSQAMMLRKRSKQKMQLVGKQAGSCFCQQEGPEMLPRRKLGLLQACKKVKTGSGPKRNQHTAASSSFLKSAPKGCEPEELGFCPQSQRMFCTESQPETSKSAALQTTGKCDAVTISGQEDLQELPQVPERSPWQIFERAKATNELQNASLQNIELMPSSLEACKEVVTYSSPQRNHHTAASSSLLRSSPKGCEPGGLGFRLPSQTTFSTKSKLESVGFSALEMLAIAALQKEPKEVLGREAKGNSDSGICTAGKCSAIAIGGQDDLRKLPPVPERSPLQSCEKAQAANKLQNAHQKPQVQLAPLGEAGNTSLQICKKKKGSAEPQTAMATEPQSPAPQGKGIPSEQNSEETELKYTKCRHCPQFFKSQASLVEHEGSHARRFFLCTRCEKGFLSVRDLNTHLRVHSGEKPFKCPECDYCCNVSSNLNRHRRRMHSREMPHLCLLCGKSFVFVHSLAMHWQMQHKKKEVYACADCGQLFRRRNDLNAHMRFKHPSEAVERGCSVEGQLLPSPGEVSSESTCLVQQTKLS